MQFEEKTIRLRDGREAVLRTPVKADAQALIDYLRVTNLETPFLMRSPEEPDIPLADEEAFIERVNANENGLMILCEVDGALAGTCSIAFNARLKTRHRANIGIALYRAYWGLGIGTALMNELIAIARAREGVMQVELDFIEGNARARALYEKMGFRIVGLIPNAVRQPDGTLVNEYRMILQLS